MPGIYSNPVIYTGGPSFLGSSNVTIIVVALVNLTIDVDDINTFPGDIKNITVNLTDKYGNKVLNGTVNTTINGKTYFADVANGTATFVDVLLDETETEYNFTVNYNGNNYYNDANSTALIKLVKINTNISAADIEGLPADNKALNITLKDEYGNVINFIPCSQSIFNRNIEQSRQLLQGSPFSRGNRKNFQIFVIRIKKRKFIPHF